MSNLVSHATKSYTSASSAETMAVRLTAAAQHKSLVRVRVHNKSSTPGVVVYLKRGATGGTLNSSQLLAKVNAQDTETIQTLCYDFSSASGISGGTIVDSAWVAGSGVREFRSVRINGAETLTVSTLATGATADIQVEIDVDE
jgi:hypothetical protein